MAKYEVLKKKVTVKVAGLTVVIPPTIDFNIEVELDNKIIKEAKSDPLLRKKFKDQANDILVQTQRTVDKKCKIFDKILQGMIDSGEDVKLVKKNLDGLNNALQEDYRVAMIAAEKGVKKVWDQLIALKKEWKKFKIKIKVSIVGALVNIGVGILALLASPFTGGAGGAVAILGFIKAGVTIANNIKKIGGDIVFAKKEFLMHLKTVEAVAKSKGLNVGNEVSGAVLEEFLSISQPTIKSCLSCFETLRAKHAKLILDNHELSTKIQSIQNEQKSLREEFLKATQIFLKKHPTRNKTAEYKKIQSQWDSNTKAGDKLIAQYAGKVLRAYDRNKKDSVDLKNLDQRVKQLMIKDPSGLKVFREGLKFAALGLSLLDANKIASEATDLAIGIGGAAESYVYDKLASKALDGTVFDAA